MESANLHHHQQQEDYQLGLSCYQNSILNAARNNTNSRDVIKQHIYEHNVDLVPISQDLGLPFTETSTSVVSDESFMVHQLQYLARIKQELWVTGSYSGLPDFISSSPTSSVENLRSKIYHQRIRYNDSNQCMLSNNLSNGCQMKNDQHMDQVPSSEELIISYSKDASVNSYRGTFSQIFPTLNISNLNEQTSIFDINLPALDPFGSPTFNGSLNYQPSSLNAHNLGGRFNDNGPSYDLDQIDSKIAQSLIIETTDPKRPANNYEATPTKKSKLQLRPSCTPLKVRKEKLGDRISALQQMVAPFGKTDTASVLMEAIGYIKFLQHQVETLSMPYMNSTHKASRISTQVGSIIDGKNEETNRDLRSRGLCLVPISCLSYVTYGGGSIWTTP